MASRPQHTEPHGMEKYDAKVVNDNLGALSDEQQEKLNQFKIQTRQDNEKYLRNHPEVECMLADFLSEVLLKQPDNIREFAAGHFTNPNLRNIINDELQKRENKVQENLLMKPV